MRRRPKKYEVPYMDYEGEYDDHQNIRGPVYREAVHVTTSRCCAYGSVGREGQAAGVEGGSKHRGRRIDGEGDRGGSNDVTNRVRGISHGGFKEGSQ